MTKLTRKQIQQTLRLAEKVADILMHFYQSELTVQLKSDNSPVTEADLKASQLLELELPNIAKFPVLSEENTPNHHEWLDWETYWLIDPIDGTKHFINQTGDFCICIALIHQNHAVFGLIYQPTRETAWLAQSGEAVVQKYQHKTLSPLSPQAKPQITTATLSSCTLTEKMQTLMESTFSEYRWYQRGSALKYVDIVEGKASIYPKMWDTCEWDSAAGQCLLECAGGQVIHFDTGQPLNYGKRETLLNPHFLAYRGVSDEQVQKLVTTYQKIQEA